MQTTHLSLSQGEKVTNVSSLQECSRLECQPVYEDPCERGRGLSLCRCRASKVQKPGWDWMFKRHWGHSCGGKGERSRRRPGSVQTEPCPRRDGKKAAWPGAASTCLRQVPGELLSTGHLREGRPNSNTRVVRGLGWEQRWRVGPGS